MQAELVTTCHVLQATAVWVSTPDSADQELDQQPHGLIMCLSGKVKGWRANSLVVGWNGSSLLNPVYGASKAARWSRTRLLTWIACPRHRQVAAGRDNESPLAVSRIFLHGAVMGLLGQMTTLRGNSGGVYRACDACCSNGDGRAMPAHSE